MHIEKSISLKVLESWVKFNKSWKEKQIKGIIKEISTLTPKDSHSFGEWKGPGVLTINLRAYLRIAVIIKNLAFGVDQKM